MAGSPALDAARRVVETQLREMGLAVTAHHFPASTSRIQAVSVLGAGLGWLALALYPPLVLPAAGWVVALVGSAGLALVALVAYGIAQGQLPSRTGTIDAVNLEARRDQPRLWLVAHLDSKSQRVSLAARVLWVVVFALGVVTLIGALGARLAGTLTWWSAIVVTAPVLVSGGVLSVSAAGNDSAGAVDNATGVVALLAAARALGDRRDVGVLITDAEEFAMEGARAWVAATRPRGAFVNFDGIDSRGRCRIMPHGRRHNAQGTSGASRAIAAATLRALRSERQPADIASLPPGVLVDGVVLARSGMPGVTVSRGDWRTLCVVHTARDVARRVRVEAAVTVGEAVATAVRRWLVDAQMPES